MNNSLKEQLKASLRIYHYNVLMHILGIKTAPSYLINAKFQEALNGIAEECSKVEKLIDQLDE